ncbi:MAG: pyridoxal 5'-phosphate synthase glutaminase subunit PdxT [Bacteroidetes bacterium]|nr:pyridoxal 5'-phosphate synthase glutaminase subunit PdxT [Bacteroidota bacterium]
MSYRIGILALQGDFAEHASKLRSLGHEAIEVRRVPELDGLDGLIIPGGESTTIAKLEDAASRFTLATPDAVPIFDAISALAKNGLPVWGTCMGSIVLAQRIEGSAQGRIALMDVTVRRNAFGPQRNSAEVLLAIPSLGSEPFPAVFIRAPLFIESSATVERLAEYAGGFVMARQGSLLITAFHPELTDDPRVHQYFLRMIDQAKGS